MKKRLRLSTAIFLTLFLFIGAGFAYAGDSSKFQVEIIGGPIIPPGSGGGIGGPGPMPTAVLISGLAYPFQPVTLLKDAQMIGVTDADINGEFYIDIEGLSSGNYIFSLYSEDIDGVRSILLNFPAGIQESSTTVISEAFIPPTVTIDKSTVEKGSLLSIAGQTAPNAEVAIIIDDSANAFFEIRVTANSDGIYTYQLDTTDLNYGEHHLRVQAIKDGRTSTFSHTLAFAIGDEDTILPGEDGCAYMADLNDDCRVNLVDFSIAAFWYNREVEGDFIAIEAAKLNGDKMINLQDFSIMAFYWTG